MLVKLNKSKKKKTNVKEFTLTFKVREKDIYEDLDFVNTLSTEQIHKEEKKLFYKYHALRDKGFAIDSKECLSVQRQILELNINGIVWIARKYYSGLINAKKDEWEVISLVCIGVAEAIPNYKNKGYTFLSFARYQIRHIINEFVHNDRGLSSYFSQKTRKLEEAEKELQKEYGDISHSIYEYEQKTGMSAATICKMDALRTVSSTISMEMEGVAEAAEKTFDSPEKNVIKNEELSVLYSELNKLSDIERDVIDMYYGFNHESLNYKEIGKRLGMTPQKVKEILDSCILNLRDNPSIKSVYMPKDKKKKKTNLAKLAVEL